MQVMTASFQSILTWLSAESVGVVEALLPYRYKKRFKKPA